MTASAFACTRAALGTLALLLLTIVPASAADTGSISGTVFDQSGMPVAEARITLRGQRAPGGRAVVTGESGAYRFDFVLPGEYVLEIVSAAGTLNRAAVVELE